MNIKFYLLFGMFISVSIYGVTDSYLNNDSLGVIHFVSIAILLVFTLLSNSKIEKAKSDIQEIKPAIDKLNNMIASMMVIMDKMNDTLQNLQSEKMIYASNNQILNIVKTNLDLTENKLYIYSTNLKNNIIHQNEISNDYKLKTRISVTTTIKSEKNIIINNLKLFKYSQVDLSELLNIIISEDVITDVISNYIFSDKSESNFKVEINSIFNDIFNKFLV